jgi:hypothetical protein
VVDGTQLPPGERTAELLKITVNAASIPPAQVVINRAKSWPAYLPLFNGHDAHMEVSTAEGIWYRGWVAYGNSNRREPMLPGFGCRMVFTATAAIPAT